ncbi:MAG: 30S ribosomal protein S17 [Candidatus Magasanikbacteria bacterium CG11_big_fil_rev_8_21_14_0_20_43_7]|uniref:Small ribosomal subunit protein uS17 n=1 Tax=Candidatus Magasanikbacteria bacterium CG11_big_fil_rev_8_21_14_0_20_43_7 TaxID=1974654 RepID=A0A2H0N236_9BACT|nr:MAG: 30S ribosomal protein S17 [Candidatus Magasanikbacteria bacterium CG11_big_fil_rev_8_21_14_0_20_43_7]
MISTNPSTIKKTVTKREFEGIVESATEDKTIHVRVSTTKMHPKYQKQYVTSKKYAVHDEKNTSTVGDTVRFRECRPYSKTKRWYVIHSSTHVL